MDGHDEDRPSDPASTAVPDLIERFRLRRDAWIAQADELARLRDEVRGSAEREAMEIVTSARADVRQVVMEARRELLVLSAQVQAALGEVSDKPDPAALLHKVGIDAGEYPAAEAAAQPIDAGFAPEAAIEKILTEVQADMTALADEARTLPGRAIGGSVPLASPALPAAEPAPAPWEEARAWTRQPEPSPSTTPARLEQAPDLQRQAPPPAVESTSGGSTPADVPLRTAEWPEAAPPAPQADAKEPDAPVSQVKTPPSPTPQREAPVEVRERLDRIVTAPARPAPGTAAPGEALPPTDARPAAARRAIGLSEAASKALLSSPLPSEAVPVPSGRSLWTFVALFAAIGLIVVMVTTWWLGRDAERAAPEVAAEAAPAPSLAGAGPADVAGAPADVPSVEPSSPPPPPPGGRGNLWVAAEALREVWVRTTVDGRADIGRTLAPGETISVSADRTVALRVGDAGALLVSVNEDGWRPLGVDGEVVTREFEAADGDAAAPTSAVPASSLIPAAAGPASTAGPNVASLQRLPTVETTPAPAVAGSRAPAPGPVVASASLTAPGETIEVGTTSRTLPTPASDVKAAERAVLVAAERWLDAYHRQDRAAMATLSTENLLLADERGAQERFAPGTPAVERTLDGVRVQISADMAVLTAVMTERAESPPTARVSPVSQIWVLGDEGQWKVRQARFVSEARLNQVLR